MIRDLLYRINKILEANEIPYMVSGSVALGFYTVARTTRDIDIVIELKESDVERFTNGFTGFFIDDIGIVNEVRRGGMFNLIDEQTAFKIDFIVRSRTEYGEIEFSRRQKLSLEGVELWVVSLEDLIIAKLRWIQDFQSDRQIHDIQNLLLNPNIDWQYLDMWIERLNLKTFNLLEK
ncbi:MAG: nucleotidyl transferase AbiEii/AbiGii toxin family protein [Bacteroidota bacterium]